MKNVDNSNSIYQSPILLSDDMPNLLFGSTTRCDIKYMIKYKYNHVDHHYKVMNCVQMMNNGVIYKLDQFHLHQPSEHVINGKRSELELHFVFKAQGGTTILVLGYLVDIGPETSEIIKKIIETEEFQMPTPTTYFSYIGSLTTPPFDVNVKWSVVRDKLTVKKEDLIDWKGIVETTRELFDRGGRDVVLITGCDNI